MTPAGLDEFRRELEDRAVAYAMSRWGYDVVQVIDPDGNEWSFERSTSPVRATPGICDGKHALRVGFAETLAGPSRFRLTFGQFLIPMRNLTYRAVVGAACLLAVSCSESTAPTLEADVEEALEQLASIDELTGGATTLLGGVTLPRHAAPGVCPFNPGTQRFVCPSATAQGITMSRYYQLLDATGAPQPGFNANVTAIHSVHERDGTITGNAGGLAFTIVIDDEDDLTLSGLQSTTRTLTGTSTTLWTQTTPHETVTYTGTRATELIFPASGGYPTGTITTQVTSSTSSGLSTATITYNGTSVVTLTAALGAQTVNCTMNLATPSAPANCS